MPPLAAHLRLRTWCGRGKLHRTCNIMGMFDYLRCEIPLEQHPDIPVDSSTLFQTKDLENGMMTFIITSDGCLVYEETKMEQHEKNPDNRWDMGWHQVRTGKLIPYHGMYGIFHGQVLFYTTDQVNREWTWAEYLATFTHGKLESIHLTEGRV